MIQWSGIPYMYMYTGSLIEKKLSVGYCAKSYDPKVYYSRNTKIWYVSKHTTAPLNL